MTEMLSQKHYETLVENLAKEVSMCRDEIFTLQEELKRRQHRYDNAVEIKEHYYPSGTPEVVALHPITAHEPQEGKRRFRTEHYLPHIIPFLTEHGASYYKEIHKHLQSSLSPDITVSQVNKFLNKISIDPQSPIQRSTANGRGYFLLSEQVKGAEDDQRVEAAPLQE